MPESPENKTTEMQFSYKQFVLRICSSPVNLCLTLGHHGLQSSTGSCCPHAEGRHAVKKRNPERSDLTPSTLQGIIYLIRSITI